MAFSSVLPYLGGGLIGGGLFNAASGGLNGINFGGTPGHLEQFQRYTPEQQQVLQSLLQQGAQNADFGPIEAQARRNFSEVTVPSLAERFTSLGGQGGQRSSAFAGTLGQAASGLESNLAALRSQYGMQQLGLGLQPQFENAYFTRQPGLGEQLLGSGVEGLSKILPLLLLSGRGL